MRTVQPELHWGTNGMGGAWVLIVGPNEMGD